MRDIAAAAAAAADDDDDDYDDWMMTTTIDNDDGGSGTAAADYDHTDADDDVDPDFKSPWTSFPISTNQCSSTRSFQSDPI